MIKVQKSQNQNSCKYLHLHYYFLHKTMNFFTHFITESIVFGILPIDEYDFELPQKDILLLENIKHLEKKKEFVSSRFLAKKMLEKQGFIYEGLEKNAQNAPFINQTNIHISLSHSDKFTTFVINSENKIGIDIEAPRTSLLSLQYKFLSEKERNFTDNNLILLTYFWCAKEALYKLYQQKKLSFAKDMYIDWENKKAILFPDNDKKQIFNLYHLEYEGFYLVCIY